MDEENKAKNLLLGYNIINVNEVVQVKLTDRRRDIYFHKDDLINKEGEIHGSYFPQKMPKEIDGWFTCQLWKLMQIFGQYMTMSCDPPFMEMRIRI